MINKKKIQLLKLSSKWHSNRLFSGNFLSKFVGDSMSFKEIREYDNNDDFKMIDWLSTAKMNHPFVKTNEAFRNLNIVFLIDVSKSLDINFSIKEQKSMREIICEMSNLMCHSLSQNNDRVGTVFFTDVIEYVFPLTKNRNNLSILSNFLLNYQSKSTGTNFSNCLEYTIKNFPKNSVIVVFSDFLFKDNFEKHLRIASKKFKIFAIKFEKKIDKNFNVDGLFSVLDKETGEKVMIKMDTANYDLLFQRQQTIENLLKRNIRNLITISEEENYYKNFFKLFINR